MSSRGRTRAGVARQPRAGAGLRLGGEHPDGHRQVAEIQRSRLLAAAVRAVDELGYERVTVAHITSRARISRRTFYELFCNREECLAAVIENVVRDIRDELASAGLEGLGWSERVRGGLWVILSLFDREPALARLCVVQSLRGGARVLERREQILAELARLVDEGRLLSRRGSECSPLTAESLVGGAAAIVYARLLRGDREPLSALHSEMMGIIAEPYLGSAAARRERARPAPAPSTGRATLGARTAVGIERDPLEGVPMRLTYRTARVLEAIAELGGRGSDPSNRGVAEHAGISDQGQISKLLARLERLGLIEQAGGEPARGGPNAWTLTPTGRQVADGIRAQVHTHEERAAA